MSTFGKTFIIIITIIMHYILLRLVFVFVLTFQHRSRSNRFSRWNISVFGIARILISYYFIWFISKWAIEKVNFILLVVISVFLKLFLDLSLISLSLFLVHPFVLLWWWNCFQLLIIGMKMMYLDSHKQWTVDSSIFGYFPTCYVPLWHIGHSNVFLQSIFIWSSVTFFERYLILLNRSDSEMKEFKKVKGLPLMLRIDCKIKKTW